MIEGKKKERTDKEYRMVDMLSASDLRLFSSDRKKFYKKHVLKEIVPEEYNKSILIGNLCHCLLLEPDKFDEKYLMSECEKPPGGMMLDFVESLYRNSVANMNEEGAVTMEFTQLVGIAKEESGYKISIEAVLKKFETDGKIYFDQLMEAKAKGMEIVCMDDINIANKIVEIVKGDEFVGEYFKDTKLCELQVEGFEIDGVEMKAMMDKLILNEKNKTIQLIDPKIVFDNQNFYREYFLKKQAYIQGYVYYKALLSRKLDLGFNYEEWEILPPIFIAVDSGCYYAPIQYRMTVGALEKAYTGFMDNGREYRGVRDILEEIAWCKRTENWTRNKRAFDNKGIINI